MNDPLAHAIEAVSHVIQCAVQGNRPASGCPMGEFCACRRAVVATLGALREASDEMIEAGKKTPVGHAWGSGGEFIVNPEDVWHDMIDAVLK